MMQDDGLAALRATRAAEDDAGRLHTLASSPPALGGHGVADHHGQRVSVPALDGADRNPVLCQWMVGSGPAECVERDRRRRALDRLYSVPENIACAANRLDAVGIAQWQRSAVLAAVADSDAGDAVFPHLRRTQRRKGEPCGRGDRQGNYQICGLPAVSAQVACCQGNGGTQGPYRGHAAHERTTRLVNVPYRMTASA